MGYRVNFFVIFKDLLQFVKQISMSQSRVYKNPQEIQGIIYQQTQELNQFLVNGNYIQAEKRKQSIQQLKKELEAKKSMEIQKRQFKQAEDLSKQLQEQFARFHFQEQNKQQMYNAQSQKLIRELKNRQQVQQQRFRQQIQNSLPYKVKESSECLNLRKMEEYMVKQQKYAQAHLVQKQIADIEKVEKQQWIKNRNIKINTAIKHLLQKQDIQLAALQKKNKTGLDQQIKIRKKEEDRLKLKFANLQSQLKTKHQKQLLAFKGQFTSKGGQGSSLLTKSRLLTSEN